MSIRVMTAVWDRSRHTGTDLLMMLALADFSDDQGNSYPAVPTLAEKCRMSSRNANLILANLRTSGELEVRPNEGPRGTNRYRIVLDGPTPLKSASPLDDPKPLKPASALAPEAEFTPEEPFTLKPTSSTPEAGFPKPLKPASDEPSLNRQEPSSKARRVRSAPAAVVDAMLPDWVPADTWADFVAMRKSIRKPMTSAAVQLQLKTLDRLRSEGHDPRTVLEQSIAASWQGLFPVKTDPRSSAVLSSEELFAGAR